MNLGFIFLEYYFALNCEVSFKNLELIIFYSYCLGLKFMYLIERHLSDKERHLSDKDRHLSDSVKFESDDFHKAQQGEDSSDESAWDRYGVDVQEGEWWFRK